MDTLEFNKLVGGLDTQIAEAKQQAERRQRREEVEHKLKVVEHQMEGLRKRKAELEKYGAAPNVDIDGYLEKLGGEKETLERQILAADNIKFQLAPEDIAELDALIVETDETPLPDEPSHAGALFQVWALRWRVVANGLTEEAKNRESLLRKAYGRIREKMKESPHPTEYVSALAPRSTGDWEAQLRSARARLEEEEGHAREMEAQRAGAREKLATLEKALQAYEKSPKKKQEKRLRHAAREAAKYEANRPEVAQLLTPQRDLLQKEFAFLWDDGTEDEEESAPKADMSNRDILSRMLRRMKSKSVIGGIHAPAESIWNGFPAHATGRAKDALNLLVSGGVVKEKKSSYGLRVSLEPKFVGRVDAFVGGAESLGVPQVDEWYAADAPK